MVSRRSAWWCGWLVVVATAAFGQATPPPPANKWEEKIQAFEAQDQKTPPPQNAILFVGSSTIVGWNLKKSFPDLVTINRGFGGSHLSDSVYFCERIVLPYKPKTIVLYAGDNDLVGKKTPERIRDDFLAFLAKVRPVLPETKVIYLGVKASIKRWDNLDRIRQTNRLIGEAAAQDGNALLVDFESVTLNAEGQPRPELFQADGLHFNAEGYRVWTAHLRPYLVETEAKE